jgi:RNA polymerase sigma factor (sigma-70 family)
MSERESSHGRVSPVTAAYLEHGDSLRRWICRFTRGIDVDDIAQEAFLRAYRVEFTRPIDQPKSFLFRIAKHLALSWCKRSHRIAYGEFEELLDLSSPEDEAIARDAWKSHHQALRALPEVCRQIYWLRLHGDLSHRQISQQLGIAVSTVEKHCIKASERVRSVV